MDDKNRGEENNRKQKVPVLLPKNEENANETENDYLRRLKQ